MNQSIEVENILKRVKKLNYKARLNLTEKIVRQLRKSKKGKHRLTELSGLGAEIWKDVDINEYLKKERQWD